MHCGPTTTHEHCCKTTTTMGLCVVSGVSQTTAVNSRHQDRGGLTRDESGGSPRHTGEDGTYTKQHSGPHDTYTKRESLRHYDSRAQNRQAEQEQRRKRRCAGDGACLRRWKWM